MESEELQAAIVACDAAISRHNAPKDRERAHASAKRMIQTMKGQQWFLLLCPSHLIMLPNNARGRHMLGQHLHRNKSLVASYMWNGEKLVGLPDGVEKQESKFLARIKQRLDKEKHTLAFEAWLEG